MSIDDEFTERVLPHTLVMMGYALALLKGQFGEQAKDEAKDVVQTIQITAWQKWETIKHRYEPKALKQWLLTCVRRECLHRMKKPLGVEEVELDDSDTAAALFEAFPGSAEHVQALELRDVIKQLPYPYGLVIFAIDYQGVPFHEMATTLEVPVERMYKIHALALAKLKQALSVTSTPPDGKTTDRAKGADRE